MIITFILIFSCYGILVMGLIIGWRISIAKSRPNAIHEEHSISIIIAARNEENTISDLLHDLQNQDYIAYEIIVVDDHSDDKTVEKVNHFSTINTNVKLIRNVYVGKKACLTKGIELALGSVIVTIDADCRVERNWLKTINQFFQHGTTQMVFGGVRIMDNGTFFSSLQALEFCSLIGSGAATLSFHLPTMCNGANLAFRKSAFYEVGGYEGNIDIPSGDDEFLMRKIFKKYRDGIQFLNDQDAIVTTHPQTSICDFIHQRIRWAGKWNHHQTFFSKALALFIFSFQLSVIVLPFFVGTGLIVFTQAIILLILKACMELIFIKQASQFMKTHWNWRAFLMLQFTYPFYVVVVALLSTFKAFVWKGRRLR